MFFSSFRSPFTGTIISLNIKPKNAFKPDNGTFFPPISNYRAVNVNGKSNKVFPNPPPRSPSKITVVWQGKLHFHVWGLSVSDGSSSTTLDIDIISIIIKHLLKTDKNIQKIIGKGLKRTKRNLQCRNRSCNIHAVALYTAGNVTDSGGCNKYQHWNFITPLSLGGFWNPVQSIRTWKHTQLKSFWLLTIGNK